ncbi:NAD(P)-dependent alcohol dehydrogenase [Nonomuraea sp. MG754425]|uniref:NAD(P)-dependent alcohol dehydrogenase n=1 Tax=Nonomuraea sp. MG754425 TaxID=2570319 RepID=UPI001F3F695C|nr:NAD(P)-dependent alcohol dehydrogenase [Nonomuraea sp. MG754425]MCF6467194.1 NAD(P)-dependent alcohol dehydrogenase [Nonomuraea sp. MG754425]
MKAIVHEVYGDASVLSHAEVERPEPGDDEVLLRVHAAGLDPGVWHLMTGQPYFIRLATGLRRPKGRLGGDVAGLVHAVGAKVTTVKPGDQVFGTCDGSFAEYALARPGRLVPIPAGITFEQAAAVPTSATAALQALRAAGEVRTGDRVLVIGAGGGVGSFAVQLARMFGAEVTGVCGPSKAGFVRSLGARHVIDYTREDFADGPRRYDLVLDTAGNRPLSHLRRALDVRGRAVIIGGEGGGPWLSGTDRQLRAALIGPFTRRRKPLAMFSSRDLGDLRFLAGLLGSGELVPAVGGTYALGEVPEAIRVLAEGHVQGKIVITVA